MSLHTTIVRHLRWQILCVLYNARPEPVTAPVLDSLIEDQVGDTPVEALQREAGYLAGLGLVQLRAGMPFRVRITSAGVDVVEGWAACPDGIARAEEAAEIRRAASKNADLRWRILLTVNSGGYLGVSKPVILSTVSDQELPVGPDALEREVSYLLGLGLVEVAGSVVKLTPRGMDIVEYTAEAPAGVGREPKYW